MNNDQFHRTRLLLGDAAVDRLRRAAVAVIGLGGVGSYAAEALARAGVGRLLLVDADTVDVTNINRQLYALHTTVGRDKADVARERIAQINPAAQVDARPLFVDADTINTLPLDDSWHVVDAIDTVHAKTCLLQQLHGQGIPCVSSMGAARRCDPTRIQSADIAHTRGCPLAREVRRILRQDGITSGILCVFSDEPPLPTPPHDENTPCGGKAPVGSIAHLPGLFGLTAAGHIINSIVGMARTRNT